jgi:hypothetical protein
MAEKNILAYFHSPEQAEGIASKLNALRAITVQVDRFSRYPGEGMNNIMNPLTGNIASLVTLTQGAEISSRDEGILIAADPSASGMSDGGDGGVTGRDILLTAVVDESVYEQALRVIEQGGGMV